MILAAFTLAVCAATAFIAGLGAIVTREAILGHDTPRGADFI
ncbi:hypothetical protein [Methylobacterium sp. BTF04]|nr:hypothetical protein [Methylobacterium sp. BTF04]